MSQCDESRDDKIRGDENKGDENKGVEIEIDECSSSSSSSSKTDYILQKAELKSFRYINDDYADHYVFDGTLESNYDGGSIPDNLINHIGMSIYSTIIQGRPNAKANLWTLYRAYEVSLDRERSESAALIFEQFPQLLRSDPDSPLSQDIKKQAETFENNLHWVGEYEYSYFNIGPTYGGEYGKLLERFASDEEKQVIDDFIVTNDRTGCYERTILFTVSRISYKYNGNSNGFDNDDDDFDSNRSCNSIGGGSDGYKETEEAIETVLHFIEIRNGSIELVEICLDCDLYSFGLSNSQDLDNVVCRDPKNFLRALRVKRLFESFFELEISQQLRLERFYMRKPHDSIDIEEDEGDDDDDDNVDCLSGTLGTLFCIAVGIMVYNVDKVL